jgi:hypothetical protein
MLRAFEAFKETNDDGFRSNRAQRRRLIDDRLARINATIDAQARRLDR